MTFSNGKFIIIIFVFIIILCLVYLSLFRTKNKKKYAVCLWGQLRATDAIIENFYKNLIEPLNADIFFMLQEPTNGNNINQFNKNVINGLIYDPPNDETICMNLKDIKSILNSSKPYGCNIYRIFQNWYMIEDYFGELFENNYEYIILSRTDFNHLIPFPDIINLSNNDSIIWNYDGHDYGGINSTLVCVPSKFIKEYLVLFFIHLNNDAHLKKYIEMINEDKGFNIERLMKIGYDYKKWNIGKIENNAFIAANDTDEVTNWGKIQYSPEHDCYYKYENTFNAAINSLEKYKNNQRWHYTDNENYIKLS